MAVNEDLRKLVAFLRKEGVTSYKAHGDSVEITLHPSSLFPESAYQKKKREAENTQGEIKNELPAYMQDPEAAIDWSSGGFAGDS